LFKTHFILHLDSAPAPDKSQDVKIFARVQAILLSELGDSWAELSDNVTLQQNGHDCGIHVIENARALLHRGGEPPNVIDGECLRLQYAKQIVSAAYDTLIAGHDDAFNTEEPDEGDVLVVDDGSREDIPGDEEKAEEPERAPVDQGGKEAIPGSEEKDEVEEPRASRATDRGPDSNPQRDHLKDGSLWWRRSGVSNAASHLLHT